MKFIILNNSAINLSDISSITYKNGEVYICCMQGGDITLTGISKEEYKILINNILNAVKDTIEEIKK